MNTASRALVAACMAVGVAVIPRADAMQMDLTRAELCGLSDAVVYGEVTDLETLWSPAGEGKIERRALLSVNRVIRGDAMQGAEIVLPGGKIGEQWHWVEDVPELAVDTQYVLFLDLSDDGRTFQVIGGEAGAIRVAPNGVGQGERVQDIAASLEACNAK